MAMAFLQKLLNPSSVEVSGKADAQTNQLVAQGNPPYMEVRRRGDGWSVASVTAFAALVAFPTTAAQVEFYNNGSRLAVVSDLHCFKLLGTAVAEGESIWAMITTAKAVPTLTALTLYSMSGKAFEVPTATSELVTGVATTVVANGWMPYGSPNNFLAAATPFSGWSVPIDGKLIIPPGCSLCLQVVAAINTAAAYDTLGMTFDWVSATVDA